MVHGISAVMAIRAAAPARVFAAVRIFMTTVARVPMTAVVTMRAPPASMDLANTMAVAITALALPAAMASILRQRRAGRDDSD
jgi:hypothetical protein